MRDPDIRKVLVIGSGPIVIGQAAEFDYAGTQACRALKEEGIETVLLNSNPATIMTDPDIADHVYIEPLTVPVLKALIEKERPDALLPTMGGQAGLNLAMALDDEGFLETQGVRLIGANAETIRKAEDRLLFKETMQKIGEPVAESEIVHAVDAGLAAASRIGYPVVLRPAYTLGGSGGGIAENEEECRSLLEGGLRLSRVHEVLVERCIAGWKEIEYEVMRDGAGNVITICNMENMDPVGIHTGDSIVAAPSQTLTDKEYQMLRTASRNIISELEIVGGCNVQFALHPESFEYIVIEVNPRVSRSSALASKATGYPIARVAAKAALGYRLDEIRNAVTGKTTACFEPALDYCVVKMPRLPFDKFRSAEHVLGTQMKATGEVMAVSDSFEGGLMKAIRSLEQHVDSLDSYDFSDLDNYDLEKRLRVPDDRRVWLLAEAFRRGVSIDRLHILTMINPWFLEKIRNLVETELSVARDIARIIGATASRDGYMEGNGYQVTWTYGHLCTLKEPGDYTPAWRPWALTQLPMIPPRFGIKLIEQEHITKQFAIIEKLMQAADGIVNCGDAGQEGELIQRWVMQKAQAKCPVKRLWISSMTDEAIREGFAKLKDQQDYQPLYMAGLSRAVGDWLLGMNCTRLYTLKYGQNRQVLSIGRVQTPTLALIVNRQKEINNFKPEPYWVLATVYRDTTFTATKVVTKREQTQTGLESAEREQARTEFKGKFTSKEEGEEAFKQIEGKPFVITKVEKKEGKEQPPQLYDLTSLQVDCNKKFGFSAEQTLNLIQTLYERKFTTYPRVDTQYLSDDIYPKCPQTMNGLYQVKFGGVAPYADLIRPIGGKPLKKSKRVFDTSKVTDHHAIIPTGVIPQSLSDAERKVFDLVARRFIAVFLPDCKFSTTTVLGEVALLSSPEGDTKASPRGGVEGAIEFKATGKEILDPGWRVVLPPKLGGDRGMNEGEPDNSSDPQPPNLGGSEEKTLPTFTKGESGEHKPTLTEKMTTPPPYYTEATLLRAMETAGKFVEDEELRAAMKENGIGRPSSRASIIETLFKRHYIKRERKRLVATETGIELIDLIREDLLKSCELTGIWEKKLRDIEHQKYDAQQFIDELKQQVTDIVNDVMSDPSNRRITTEASPPALSKGRGS